MSYTPEEAARIVELTRGKEEPRVQPGERAADNDYRLYGQAAEDAKNGTYWRQRALAAEKELAVWRADLVLRKKLVVIESPYAGDVEANVAYARELLLDSLRRGEYPIASHLLYTQVLDDTKLEERKLGIEAGLAWGKMASVSVMGVDRGISGEMKLGAERAIQEGRLIVERKIR